MSSGRPRFEELTAAARREPAPVGDVSRRMAATIVARNADRSRLRPMLVFAAVYAIVCLTGLLIAYQYSAIGDPMTDFFAMASEIAP